MMRSEPFRTGLGYLVALLVAAFANIFLQMPALMIAISVTAIGIFSAL